MSEKTSDVADVVCPHGNENRTGQHTPTDNAGVCPHPDTKKSLCKSYIPIDELNRPTDQPSSKDQICPDTFAFGHNLAIGARGCTTAVAFRYKLDRLIGSGGQGEAWLATDLKGRRRVVVKLLRPELRDNDACRERAKWERMRLARLSHPNVVTYHDGGVCRFHGPYIAMEYVRGESLLRRLQKHSSNGQPMTVRDAVEVSLAIALGLQHTHCKGVLHLDVKSGNVLLPDCGYPKAKLCDYGISVPLRGNHRGAASRTFVGTPAFASPEQLCCRTDLDPRSDLYSLGVVAFTMLAGGNPFVGTAAEANSTKRCTPPVSFLRAEAPAALCALIQSLLSDDRYERPRTASAVAGNLRQILATLPPRRSSQARQLSVEVAKNAL